MCHDVPSSEANWHYLRVRDAVSSSSYGGALLYQKYFKKYCRHLTHSSWIQYYLLSTGTRLWFGQLVDSPVSTWTTLWFGQLVDSSFGTGTRLRFGQLKDNPFSTGTRQWFGQLLDSSFSTGLDYGLNSWQVSICGTNCLCGPLKVLGALSMGGKVGAMCNWPHTSTLKCQH